MSNNAPNYEDNLFFEPKDHSMPYCDILELKNEIKHLKEVLKECKEIIAHECWLKAQFSDGSVVERIDLLERINVAIGESEER